MQPDIIHPTRFPELSYVNDAPGLWRIVDALGGLNASGFLSRIGPHYRTKGELLADLARCASVYGCAAPDAAGTMREACKAILACEPMQRGARDGATMGMISIAIDAARAALEGA